MNSGVLKTYKYVTNSKLNFSFFFTTILSLHSISSENKKNNDEFLKKINIVSDRFINIKIIYLHNYMNKQMCIIQKLNHNYCLVKILKHYQSIFISAD